MFWEETSAKQAKHFNPLRNTIQFHNVLWCFRQTIKHLFSLQSSREWRLHIEDWSFVEWYLIVMSVFLALSAAFNIIQLIAKSWIRSRGFAWERDVCDATSTFAPAVRSAQGETVLRQDKPTKMNAIECMSTFGLCSICMYAFMKVVTFRPLQISLRKRHAAVCNHYFPCLVFELLATSLTQVISLEPQHRVAEMRQEFSPRIWMFFMKLKSLWYDGFHGWISLPNLFIWCVMQPIFRFDWSYHFCWTLSWGWVENTTAASARTRTGAHGTNNVVRILGLSVADQVFLKVHCSWNTVGRIRICPWYSIHVHPKEECIDICNFQEGLMVFLCPHLFIGFTNSLPMPFCLKPSFSVGKNSLEVDPRS